MRRWALGALLLVGCKNNAPTTNDAGTDAAAIRTDYPAKVAVVPLAQRVCDAVQTTPGKRMAECCGGPPTGLLADECARLLSTSLADGIVRIDAAAVDACAKAMDASLVGCDWVTPSAPPLPDACKGLVRGLQPERARCRSPLDCQAGLHCVDNVCTAPEKIGATCGRSVDALAAATRQTDVESTHPTCAQQCSLVTHRCEGVPEAGAQCFANGGCRPGQLCVDGKCAVATAGALGQPCAGTTCAEGLRCSAKKCVAKAATGETCGSDFDCAKGGCAKTDGGRACGMTCSHAGDLDAIHKALEAVPTASH